MKGLATPRRLVGALAVAIVAIAAATTAPPSHAARPMLIGFQDDPGFRWSPDRTATLAAASRAHATIVRATAYWYQIAPVRPANPLDSFDPAYHFADIDDLVRNAQLQGMTVMLTIWGTPGWANNGAGINHAPDRLTDLYAFSRAIADRYSGRHPGFPFVGYYTVWNEPNSSRFLAPTFDLDGKPLAPFTYAGICRAVYKGVKDGNSLARVAIGQTSSRGSWIARPGAASIAPGTFARLLAAQTPAVPFDAWAHHPYSDLGAGPLERFDFPNVNLSTLHTFEQKLDEWFHRPEIPIWISEYGFQTRPSRPDGVTVQEQAAYVRQSLQIAAADPRVEMFIWFVLRDDPTYSTWDSGLIGDDGQSKPAFAAFADAAASLDARYPVVSVAAGTSHPVLRIPVWELAIRDGVGARIGSIVSVFDGRRLVGRSTPASTIAVDGYASFPLPIRRVKAGKRYYVYLRGINDIHGNRIGRRAIVIGTSASVASD